MQLDSIDRHILRLLQEDGRASYAALAEKVGLTTTPLRQRVEKLREAGVIQGFMARIDPARVDASTTAFILVTLRDHSRSNHDKFVEGLACMPEVLEAHHIAGEEDFLLKVVVPNVAKMEAFLLERLTPMTAISRVKTTFVLSTAKTGAPIPVGEENAS